MRLFSILIAFAILSSTSPPLVKLKQDVPRAHFELKLPAPHTIGPTIPGLQQGAIPQGLVYWREKDWFLISCYFDEENQPSVVVALDAKGEMVRCLTLLDQDGTAHVGHVGGLAVSEKYLWIGSDDLYRVPLAEVESAETFDYLKLNEPFQAECVASFVAYHQKRIWVGEFVARNTRYKENPNHKLKDRNGVSKFAWIVGYELNDDETLKTSIDEKVPLPDAIFSVRQKVQGIAFLGESVVLSVSYGRNNDSTLAAYRNPIDELCHAKLELSGRTVPVWHLDGQNKQWEQADFPPMSEGVAAYGERLGLIFESGAAKYQRGGRGPIDTVMLIELPESE